MKRFSLVGCIFILCSTVSCGSKAKFEYWNESDSLEFLKTFVEKSVNKNSDGYIPKEDRLAVFDMDGTLYGELFPAYLEYVMYEYRVLEDESYKNKATAEQIELANDIRNCTMKNAQGEYESTAGNTFPSGTDMRHATLAAQVYSEMKISEFDTYCKNFFAKEVPLFKNMTYGSAFYLPMKEVVNYLQENEYEVYVVSGSDRFICRNLCCDYLNLPSNHIIGMDVRLRGTEQDDETKGVSYTFKTTDDVIRTDEVIIKNLKMNKVLQINQEIGKQPVLSFGNSGGDEAMHNFTISKNKYNAAAFMLVADNDVEDYAVLSKAQGLREKWESKGFHVFSMKNDFDTIYGKNVSKK